jgi:bacterioferritin B
VESAGKEFAGGGLHWGGIIPGNDVLWAWIFWRDRIFEYKPQFTLTKGTPMLISKELESAINQQVGNEFGASLQYVSIAAYFDNEDLEQLSGFFFRQADEERMHAMKFVKYVLDAGGQVRIPAIPTTPYNFQSAVEAVQAALDWEVEVTKQINGLMDIGVQQKDYIAQTFLQWFVTEQLEEVSTMNTLLNVVKRAKDNLLLVEEYLNRMPDPHAAGGEAAA